MKRFIQNIKNIWKVEELRKRILLTLTLILVYRVGSFVILPGVNYTALMNAQANGGQNTLETLLSLFSGGGFTNASVMALGIMPYISASIIMQLLGMAVPAVQKMQNEGESGRKRINNYTRILTIIICALQAPSYLTLYVQSKGAMPVDANTFWWTQTILVLIAGSMFAVWLGERITDKGIGNGISLLITVGILARLPEAFIAEFGFSVESGNLIKLVLEIVAFMVVILGTILIVQGVRKIPLNTAKRVVGARAVDEQGARSYLPIKVNASGVMPIIFAQAIMTIPVMIFAGAAAEGGGFIPGVRPGEETAEYIDTLVSRITFPGSLFLAAIAILPSIAKMAGINDAFAMFFGGTSILIMVGVVLDTLQQIESYLLNRHMDGLMEGTRVKGRRSANELSGF